MGLDNPLHIAFLLVIVLLVFGAKRLPEMGKSLGSGMRGFKDAIGGESHPVALATTADVHEEQPVTAAVPAVPAVAAMPAVPAAPAAPAVPAVPAAAAAPTAHSSARQVAA
ncbi:MAG: twin-arginine translocase TatA/TatE family subunit [Solirubrobacteraceae bacterium]